MGELKMKDASCSEHKEKNEICLIQISDKVEKEFHSQEYTAVASYNKKGDLVSIEFYEGIPKKLKG